MRAFFFFLEGVFEAFASLLHLKKSTTHDTHIHKIHAIKVGVFFSIFGNIAQA